MAISDEDVKAVATEVFRQLFLEVNAEPEPEPEPFKFNLKEPLLAQIQAAVPEDISWQQWIQVIATILASIAEAFANTQAVVEKS